MKFHTGVWKVSGENEDFYWLAWWDVVLNHFIFGKYPTQETSHKLKFGDNVLFYLWARSITVTVTRCEYYGDLSSVFIVGQRQG
jgi:hypothetical protein